MKLYNLNAAYSLAETLYGVTPSSIEFEDIALNGWELINNKHTRLYRYVSDTENKTLVLPCNVDVIESVHVPLNDAQMTSNKTVFNSIDTLFIENYIDAWKRFENPYSQAGKMLDYKEGENTLYFSRDYKKVMVIYHGILVDDETGLPLVNNKELRAIAAYVAYISFYKEGLKRKDSGFIQLAQSLNADWLKLCNSARIPDHLSQNDMNAILDVKTRWDRKQYGKSLEPMK